MQVKGYLIEVEGIDKCGKDLVKTYITQLSNYKYIVQARGILSNMVYAEKYNRNYNYNLQYKPIIIYLNVEKDDWEIRCNMTNEPKINYDKDKQLFDKYISILGSQGVTILEYNTSKETPIQIAKSILNYLEIIEKKNSNNSI